MSDFKWALLFAGTICGTAATVSYDISPNPEVITPYIILFIAAAYIAHVIAENNKKD